MLSVHLDIGDVVLEHGWDVDLSFDSVNGQRHGMGYDESAHLWECALAEDDQETCLLASSSSSSLMLSEREPHVVVVRSTVIIDVGSRGDRKPDRPSSSSKPPSKVRESM